jgi:hypothetical protein
MIPQKTIGAALGLMAWSFAAAPQPWLQSFPVNVKELATQGESPYFVLKPGYQATFEGKEAGQAGKLVITVLNETLNVGGVDTRIVEEREWSGGGLIEVSRNYFAFHPATGDVYYFGEDVDMYKKGKVANHDGSWRHGTNGAKFGLMMPGKPAMGMRFYQELAKGTAMDRSEIVSLTDKLTTRAGTFERCVKSKETTPLEMLAREYKIYAPGVGLVKDGELELVSHQYVQAK